MKQCCCNATSLEHLLHIILKLSSVSAARDVFHLGIVSSQPNHSLLLCSDFSDDEPLRGRLVNAFVHSTQLNQAAPSPRKNSCFSSAPAVAYTSAPTKAAYLREAQRDIPAYPSRARVSNSAVAGVGWTLGEALESHKAHTTGSGMDENTLSSLQFGEISQGFLHCHEDHRHTAGLAKQVLGSCPNMWIPDQLCLLVCPGCWLRGEESSCTGVVGAKAPG